MFVLVQHCLTIGRVGMSLFIQYGEEQERIMLQSTQIVLVMG